MSNTNTPPIEELISGYRRFRENDWAAQQELWSELGRGQSPRTMVISCSDSRVDPAQIFDTLPGSIFVVRNVAALVPPFETHSGPYGAAAALEFAVQVLGVEEVLVLGHESCGGCKAALTGAMEGSEVGSGFFVGNWVSMLDHARESVVAEHGTDGREAQLQMELAAVKASLENLLTFPFVAQKVETGELALRGAHFSISNAELRVLAEPADMFRTVRTG